MTKTAAAEILVTYINVRARELGVTKIDKDFIEASVSEAKHAGGMISDAGHVAPHWTMVRATARRQHA